MRLTERLVESSLGGRAFLCNSGAEANECAIKLVRRHAHGRGIDRPEIVVLDQRLPRPHARRRWRRRRGSPARTSSGRFRPGSCRFPATIRRR